MKKSFLNQGILIMLAFFFFTNVQAQRKSDTDRSQPEQGQINYRDGQQSYKIKMKGDKILELYVDDKLIPESDYSKYEEKIRKILVQVKKDKEMAELDKQQAVQYQQQAKLAQEQAAINKQQAEQDARQAQQLKMQVEKIERQKFIKDQQQSISDQQQAELKIKQKAAQDARQAQQLKIQVEKLEWQKARKDMEQSEKDQVQAKKESARAVIDAQHAEEDGQLLKNLLTDLVKENIIPDEKNDLTIILTDEEFVVNGNKQTEVLHNKFKAIYLKKKGTKINYQKAKGSSNFSITNDEDLKK